MSAFYSKESAFSSKLEKGQKEYKKHSSESALIPLPPQLFLLVLFCF